ncbi:MAG: phosphoribosylformylglycinamidine synthase [Oscillospiraceae bacterium]|nr:phosphoribosylformylglycinamidine synthase [Oscillospiraceae bacterium]
MVYRILTEKKETHNIEAQNLSGEIKNFLGISSLKNLRIINRYDIEGIGGEIFEKSKYSVFADPATDNILGDLNSESGNIIVFAAESLPGQYNQKADTCSQCLQILTGDIRPLVRTAKIYVLEFNPGTGELETDINKIKDYIINKIESREAALDEYQTLKQEYDNIPYTVETIENFINSDRDALGEFLNDYSLAMDIDDILFCRDYFKNSERRDPTITEIRMIDTYWSDHCRHTTFFTEITDVEIEDTIVENSFENYLDLRREVYKDKNNKKSVTLMDIATIAAKYLKKQGKLDNLDESDEVNACSVKIKVNVKADGFEEDEEWLLMFKNETHNHPTEIEPFGGAATCLGGGIRDPLSGRSYVYQAMRITGAADPRQKTEDTLKGKLPQFKITRTAADGYSSYGNQIGAASGLVQEIYHDNYAAKRMELGAIVGAAPKSSVKRETPIPGDVIILLGGRTGRDGCGGATGSSKSQDSDSLTKSGAEVQKGDPIEERKIQRLFRNPETARMIKRCNDFGAGGVSVAIGELADSILIDLSLVPVKYPGLDGTELAISESQERMAVVVSDEDSNEFILMANLENLEATKVAVVTDDNRLKMMWNGSLILSLDRGFLNSNGAKKQTQVRVVNKDPDKIKDILSILYNKISGGDIKQAFIDLLSDLNICSQKGLAEQFDSSAGGGTVVSPFGGRHRLTPSQFMAAKIPVLNGETDTCSVMAHGYSPYISEISPYRGAMYAVVESVSKLIAAGVNLSDIYLSFQEYFPSPQNNPERFGAPFESLLGALEAQVNLGLAAIGGKDSMSGSYAYLDDDGEKINTDVPPALVSFAVGTADSGKIVSNEFKNNNSYVYLLKPDYNPDGTVDFKDLKNLYNYINKLTDERLILSSYSLGFGGIGEAVFKMSAGSGIGFSFNRNISQKEIFSSYYGAFLIETKSPLSHGELLGGTDSAPNIFVNNNVLNLNELTYKWLLPLEGVFETGLHKIKDALLTKIPKIEYNTRPSPSVPVFYNSDDNNYNGYNPVSLNFAKPRVLIPVFPGTNGEYETAKQFESAGGMSDIFVFANMNPGILKESIENLAEKISECQIFAISGGSSGGGEPVGSGKLAAAILKNPKITESVRNLLFKRNGLILGLGGGFQALVKSGLLPYGDIRETEGGLSLSINKIGRYQAYMTYTRIASVNSPWFINTNAGDIHALPVSYGEGRVCVNPEEFDNLIKNGQIASQYCDLDGEPTMHPYYNPGSSEYAIEGIFSPDGRILGKMGHNERMGANVMKNIPGNKSQMVFLSGVRYFK